MTLTVGGLFDGIGLLAYGLHQAGLEHQWLCEVDPWRRSILERRFPGVPVIDDVRAAGAVSCGRVDVIAGGFPCKGASTAGKREGFGHPETVLWREMRRVVGELLPRYVVVENVRNILSLHDGAVWGEVLGDLAAFGYDVVWDCLPAAAVGAPHRRDRVFAVASYADGDQLRQQPGRVGRPGGSGPAFAGGDGAPAADANGSFAVGDAGVVAFQDGRSDVGGGSEAAANASNGGWSEAADADEPGGLGRDAGSGARGVRVDWGKYEPAIRRWEQVHGPAPEPLVRRVDDRGAARVERSRLSALGDGVQCQLGRLVGEFVMGLERSRLGLERAA